jgi:hypothetical protein
VAGYTLIRRKETGHRVWECARLYIHRKKGNRSQSTGTCQDIQIKGNGIRFQSKGVWQVIYTQEERKQIRE